MSYNGSGTFLINSTGQPVVAGTVISSSTFNALTTDLANGLSTAITKDGQTTVTNNIPLNSFKVTNLGAGTVATDAAQLGQVQSGAVTTLTVTGTDTYVATISPILSSYATGNQFKFIVPNTNTGPATLNISSVGAKALTKNGATALAAGDLAAGTVVVVVYDGTQFQVINLASSGGGGGTGTVTSVSVVSANGFSGTVATATTTPAITLGTSITGLLKGNGTAVSAATSGTDYAPATSGTSILYGNGSGGFSNVTVGSGLSFVSGTLTATGGGSGTIGGSGTTNYISKFTGTSSIGNSIIYDTGSAIGIGTTTLHTGYKFEVDNGDGRFYGLTVGRGSGAVAENTAVGSSALISNSSGTYNTALGYNCLVQNTTGSYNTAVGYGVLSNSSTVGGNTGVGYISLYYTSTGNGNSAFGYGSLLSNTGGAANSAFGQNSLTSNIGGSYNSAFGQSALLLNTSGTNNTAVGYYALRSNTTGVNNVAVGYSALYTNYGSSSAVGSYNVAVGSNAGYAMYSSIENTCVGDGAGQVISTGNGNCSFGSDCSRFSTTGSYNTAYGTYALFNNSTGSGNIAIGGTTSAGSVSPAYNITNQSNYISMGSTSVTNAYIQVAWTVVSDARDKTNFGTVPHGLDFVTKLNPVSYQFKVSRDNDVANGDVRYGFKAQDILALEGDNSVIVDAKNADKLYYNSDSMVPVLVNAIKDLKAELDALKAEIAILKGA